MVQLQPWSFGECGVPLPYHYSQIHGVMVTVVGNGHGDSSSNPRRDWLHFTLH